MKPEGRMPKVERNPKPETRKNCLPVAHLLARLAVDSEFGFESFFGLQSSDFGFEHGCKFRSENSAF